jgi:hypothetical protein
LGIQEYWQFDPKGEWIAEGLRGYRLEQGVYQSIGDGVSQVLALRLEVSDELSTLISFYRLDTGEKLLLPVELKAEMISAQQEASRLAAKLAEYEARFGSLDT